MYLYFYTNAVWLQKRAAQLIIYTDVRKQLFPKTSASRTAREHKEAVYEISKAHWSRFFAKRVVDRITRRGNSGRNGGLTPPAAAAAPPSEKGAGVVANIIYSCGGYHVAPDKVAINMQK
jgi:hypothetical protein